MTLKTGLDYCCRHLRYDSSRHRAAWGARLIYDEVMRGGTGVVANRQDAVGTYEDRSKIVEVVEKWTERFRKNALKANSDETFTISSDGVMVMGSPQSSYGYLYVTGVLMKEADDVRPEGDGG